MIAAYETHGGNHVAVTTVAPDKAHSYGIAGVADQSQKISRITQMVEKPKPGTAPSNLRITGRYILDGSIFSVLGNQGAGAGGEIQLTDAMIRLMADQPFHAVRFDGSIYDCGSKLGFLTANIALGLADPALKGELAAEVRKLI
jgi:UTP--glucose-1-phosphate uridylyltransferase